MRFLPILGLIGIAALVGYPSFRHDRPAPMPAHALPDADAIANAAEPNAPTADDWDVRDTKPARIAKAAAFAYAKNHPPTPLPAVAFAALTGPAAANADVMSDGPVAPAIDIEASELRSYSRDSLCNAVTAVARANDLPVAFFGNLIWQESNFHLGSISPAGALGIAQFMPETANDRGLVNPFEPIHALFSAGKLLRKLRDQYGNLGIAAAAYNAGPQRVNAWLAERRGLPGETRAYVVRITGQPADRWMTGELAHDPQAMVLPARAPCPDVVAEVKEQTRFARVAGLMMELAAATDLPRPPEMRIAAGARWRLAGWRGPVFWKKPQPRLAGMKDQSRPPAHTAARRAPADFDRHSFAAR
jgi:soluble lytic murein transglycosylase-like protein